MRLSRRFAIVGATAAIVPLLGFGAIALRAVREGTRQSVTGGMAGLTRRTAEQLDQWVTRTTGQLVALGAEFEGTGLAPWQQERALRNSVLRFREFREISLFDASGRPVVSSRITLDPVRLPEFARTGEGGVRYSAIAVDDDLLPTMHVGVPVSGPLGGDRQLLVGTLNLEQIWRVVDTLRVGSRGHAMLVDNTGRLVAHGDPDRKNRIARGEHLTAHPLASAALADHSGTALVREYRDENGRRQLAVAARLPSVDWLLIVEQPTAEAFALADRLQRLLVAVIALALVITIVLGAWLGRSLIDPITEMVTATESVARGNLESRVSLQRGDEFRRLGEAFNHMAGRLEALQEETRRQERLAAFGRIAAGLVHDFSHPVKNLANTARLLLRDPDDAEYREVFRRTMERETATMNRVLDDLRQVGKPKPLERFSMELVRHVTDVAESMRAAADGAGVTLATHMPPGPVHVRGDAFALGRVWRNLLQNALDATPAGGSITVAVVVRDQRAEVQVADTGAGIEADRLANLFDEFVTTKRRGLGLGLAICRRIVEQLEGTVGVESEPGRGTTFTVRLPLDEGTGPMGGSTTQAGDRA